jgi:hypothetical protein
MSEAGGVCTWIWRRDFVTIGALLDLEERTLVATPGEHFGLHRMLEERESPSRSCMVLVTGLGTADSTR